MEALWEYIVLASLSLGLSWLAYLLIFRKDRNFGARRAFLLGTIIVSLLLPLSQVKIKLPPSIQQNNSKEVVEKPDVIPVNLESNFIIQEKEKSTAIIATPISDTNWTAILVVFYLFVVLFLLIKKISQIESILSCYRKSKKEYFEHYTMIYNNHFQSTFSFFKWIFINNSTGLENEIEKIIAHEKVHVIQYHYIDLLLLELLSIGLWFNPFIWLLKKETQLVHEFLADENVLAKGTNKVHYQTLLVNQVAEEKLICLASGFSQSLIKKRILMMNTGFDRKQSKLKILSLVPIALFLFLAVSCMNGQKEQDVVAAFEIQDMNIFYMGINNPIKIAVSGYDNSDIEVDIDKGTVSGENGSYIVRVEEEGTVLLTVKSHGKEIQKKEFIVKAPGNHSKLATLNFANEHQKIKPEQWIDSLGISENEYLQFVYWVSDSLAYEKDKIPVSANILYTGIDNLIEVPVLKYKQNIDVKINKGNIIRKNDHYVVRVKETGNATITVSIDGHEVQRKEFQVIKPTFANQE
ncbi:MAG: hypothetical protein K9H64_01950 [Bacteroidales bacterium]|nr:hypothetical protein [Bacteroidales bacterium]MCF8454691.1 hypothetical protein [Bacteroidales bacterium]